MNYRKKLSRLVRMVEVTAIFAMATTGTVQAGAGDLIGGELLVGDSNFNHWPVLRPEIAVNAGGAFGIVWVDAEDTLQLRRYTANGDAASEVVPISQPGSIVQHPAIALADSGIGVVVWESTASYSTSDIHLQRLGPSGHPIDAPLVVNQVQNDFQFQPDVAMNASGASVVVWSSMGQDGQGSGVYARRYDASGAAVGPEFQVNSYAAGEQTSPAVAMSADGSFVVTWAGPTPGRVFTDIHARQFGADGVALGDEFPVNSAAERSSSFPNIAMDTAGRYVIAWRGEPNESEPGNTSVRSFDANGPTSEQADISYEYESSPPVVALDSVPRAEPWFPQFFVLPASDTDRYYFNQYAEEIYLQQSDPAYGMAATATAAMDGNGDAVVAWVHWGVPNTVRAHRVGGLDEADLSVAISNPGTVQQNYITLVQVSVANEGSVSYPGISSPAQQVEVEISLSGAGMLGDAVGYGWACTTAATVKCVMEQGLEPNATSSFVVHFHSASELGEAVVQAQVRSPVSDAWLLNNVASSNLSVVDAEPEAFDFTDVTSVPRNSEQISDSIVVQGITAPSSVYVWNGQYSIDGAPFTSNPGTISLGQSLRVKHTAASGFSQGTTTTLRIGQDTVGDFTSTTEAADTTPDAFVFLEQVDVPRNNLRYSNVVTISGINSAASVSVTGGSYSINNGTYTNASGTLQAGQTISVRHASASDFSAGTETVLTIGGVSATFRSSTLARDDTPDTFAFAAQADVSPSSQRSSNTVTISGINDVVGISVTGSSSSYSINGGSFTSYPGVVSAGQTVTLRHNAAAAFSTSTSTILTVGSVSAAFTSTTVARDDTPDAFAFVDQAGVALGSERNSNAVTIAGVNNAVAISVSGGSYAINGGAYTSAAGTISAGQTVTVRHTASSSFATAVNTVLTVGTRSDTFTSTTVARDGTPDAFSFTDQTAVPTGNLRTSNAVTVASINDAVAIGVIGGSYSINNGAFTSAAGTVQAGDQVRVQHVSAGAASTTVNTVLSIGGVSDTFSSTTGSTDTTPNAFSFTDVAGARRNTVTTSGAVTISGINAAVPITVSGGNATWSKNGLIYQSGAGTVSNGNSVRIRVTSSGSTNTPVNVTVTIGGVTDVWTVTTGNN